MTATNIEHLSLSKASKKILPLALTMAGTQLITVASGFLCMIMLAHLGHQVLAASALMISTQISIMVIGMSLLFSLSLMVGHAYGAKNYLAIGNFMQIGWTLAIIISIPLMLLFWFIGPVLNFFDEPRNLIPLVITFFHAYIFAVAPILLSICNQQLCYGTHQQRLVIITSCLSVIVLLVTAYVLIFGKLGLPALGVAGLGYAMAAQVWFGLILMIVLICRRQGFKQFDLFTYRAHKNREYLRQMFKIGWPMSLQMSAEMLCLFVGTIMVGWIGTNALAAYQIVSQFVFLIIVPIFALSQASGIAVGQAKGAGQFHEIKNLGYASLRITLIWALLAALLFILAPKLLASFYLNVNDPANLLTVHWAVWLFLITAFSQTFDSVRNVMTGALRGLFDTRYPMVVGIIVLWFIGIPLSYIFAFIFHWGVYGIALGSTCGMLIGAVLILFRWQKLTGKLAN